MGSAYRGRMGLSALVLDLPRLPAGSGVLDSAAAELTERGIVGWERLELRTTASTGSALIGQFTFTYWMAAAVTAAPRYVSYTHLWGRLCTADRAALVRRAAAVPVPAGLVHAVVGAGGVGMILCDRAGNQHLPRSFRLFLDAMGADGR